MFCQHGKQRVHCFYAGPKGSSPKETETSWFNYIYGGSNFLEKEQNTRTIKQDNQLKCRWAHGFRKKKIHGGRSVVQWLEKKEHS
jgi:hypothetical protein